MSEKFFQALRRRLLREPGAEFDRKFWARFEDEFGGREPRGSWLGVRPARLALAAAAALAIASGVVLLRDGSAPAPLEAEIMARSELLRNLELFEPSDDEIDLTELSDEEWETLVPESA